MPSMIGDNIQTIDIAKTEVDRLKKEYGYLIESTAGLIGEAEIVTAVDTEETKSVVTSLIKRMREAYKRLQGVHEAEKAPHLERGRGVDAFFFGQMELLGRKDKKAKEGAADRLNRLLTDYDTRKLAEEQERRRKVAEEDARKAREAAAAKAKAEAEAEAARQAAERARLDHTKAAKEAVAEKKEEVASAAHVEAVVTADKAEVSYIEALAAPADIMRQRSDAGVLSTMGTEKFAEITERATLDLNALRPYLPMATLETALRKYAESVGYSDDASVQISGARFGKKAKSKVY